jgi:hypothetical protein
MLSAPPPRQGAAAVGFRAQVPSESIPSSLLLDLPAVSQLKRCFEGFGVPKTPGNIRLTSEDVPTYRARNHRARKCRKRPKPKT